MYLNVDVAFWYPSNCQQKHQQTHKNFIELSVSNVKQNKMGKTEKKNCAKIVHIKGWSVWWKISDVRTRKYNEKPRKKTVWNTKFRCIAKAEAVRNMYAARPFSKDIKSRLYLQQCAPKLIRTAHMLLEQCFSALSGTSMYYTRDWMRLDRLHRLRLWVGKRKTVIAVSLSLPLRLLLDDFVRSRLLAILILCLLSLSVRYACIRCAMHKTYAS